MKRFLGSLLILLSLFVFSSAQSAELFKTRFEIVNLNTQEKFYANRIKVNETDRKISFKFLCSNKKECGSVVDGNLFDYIVFFTGKEIELR